jgi:hypothetical protein
VAAATGQLEAVRRKKAELAEKARPLAPDLAALSGQRRETADCDRALPEARAALPRNGRTAGLRTALVKTAYMWYIKSRRI